MQSFEKKKKLFFTLRCFLAREHDLGSCWRGKVKNKTSKLHYVIELFSSFLCLPLFFFPRDGTVFHFYLQIAGLCYLILFGRRFTSTIRPMIPTDDKIQNSKSGNFTVRKMRSYWNYLWCVFNSLVKEDLETKEAAGCIVLQSYKMQYRDVCRF